MIHVTHASPPRALGSLQGIGRGARSCLRANPGQPGDAEPRAGIDARLEIEGLVAGQTLTITVRVEGSGAVLMRPDDENEDEEEFEIEGSIAGLSPLVVAGRTILTNERTRVLDRQNNPMPLSMLHVGDRVEVEGRRLANGGLLAEKIKLED